MKKRAVWICIGLCCLSLTGCVDIVQHITRKSDGTDQNIISFTIAKTLLETVAAMQGNDSIDYEEFFNELEESDMDQYEQFDAKITKIDDQTNAGYLIDMNINYKDKHTLKMIAAQEVDFIPKYEKNKMTIYAGSLQDDEIAQTDNEMAQMFLANSKYRLLISKLCMPTISRVLIKTSKDSMEISSLDLYDEYLIDIPLILLLKDKITIEIYR